MKIDKKPMKMKLPKKIHNYKLGRTLGTGSMGKVKLALKLDTNIQYAIKIIEKKIPLFPSSNQMNELDTNLKSTTDKEELDPDYETRINREIEIVSLLSHPNIVKLYDNFQTSTHYYLVFEYIDGAMLLDYIISKGRLPEQKAAQFMAQIVSGVQYIHSNRIIHRDLKIENILISEIGEVKIVDFGLANYQTPNQALTTYCGSLYFAAPELLKATPYQGPEVDIWSLGVILYVLVTGKVPFDDSNMAILHRKIQTANTTYPSYLSKSCAKLISGMLTVDPLKRWSLNKIMESIWLYPHYLNLITRSPSHLYSSTLIERRLPLMMPLNYFIINRLLKLDLGFNDWHSLYEHISQLVIKDHKCLNKKAKTQVFKLWSSTNEDNKIADRYWHPLICLYYLVMEKMDHDESSLSIKMIPGLDELIIKEDVDIWNPPGMIKTNSEPPMMVQEIETPRLNLSTSKDQKWRLARRITHLISKPNAPQRHISMPIKESQQFNHKESPLPINNEILLDDVRQPRSMHKRCFSDQPSNLILNSSSHSINSNILPLTPLTNSPEQNKVVDNWICKTSKLKSWFSVSTTSTLKPGEIIDQLMSRLTILGINFKIKNESKFSYLECITANEDRFELVRFQIYLTLLFKSFPLYGIRFRRLEGRPFHYKFVCSSILDKLKI